MGKSLISLCKNSCQLFNEPHSLTARREREWTVRNECVEFESERENPSQSHASVIVCGRWTSCPPCQSWKTPLPRRAKRLQLGVQKVVPAVSRPCTGASDKDGQPFWCFCSTLPGGFAEPTGPRGNMPSELRPLEESFRYHFSKCLHKEVTVLSGLSRLACPSCESVNPTPQSQQHRRGSLCSVGYLSSRSWIPAAAAWRQET